MYPLVVMMLAMVLMAQVGGAKSYLEEAIISLHKEFAEENVSKVAKTLKREMRRNYDHESTTLEDGEAAINFYNPEIPVGMNKTGYSRAWWPKGSADIWAVGVIGYDPIESIHEDQPEIINCKHVVSLDAQKSHPRKLCLDKAMHLEKLESIEFKVEHVALVKEDLLRTARKLNFLFIIDDPVETPPPEHNTPALKLAELVGYNGTAEDCTGAFEYKGVALFCEDLFARHGGSHVHVTSAEISFTGEKILTLATAETGVSIYY